MFARVRRAAGVAALLLTLGFVVSHASQSAIAPETSLEALLALDPAPADVLRLRAELLPDQAPPRRVDARPPTYEAGRVDRFWVGHAQAMERREIEAELRLVTRHAYWYVQQGREVRDDALRDAAAAFERQIYPGVRRLVGSEPFPGIDDDPRITVLHGEIPGVAGYVTSNDTLPRTAHPYSNEREMLYLNLGAVRPGDPAYLATLAHEFTHLVHGGATEATATWIKEGLADMVAGEVLADGGSRDARPLPESDTALLSWSDATDEDHAVAAHYRLSELFLRYAMDRYGPSFITWLAEQDVGASNVDRVFSTAGVPGGFSELFAEWVIVNVAGVRAVPGVPPYAARPVVPPTPRQLARGESVQDTVAQFGVDYYELPDPSGASIRFAGMANVPALSGVAEPGVVWTPNRADGASASLTCGVQQVSGGPGFLTYETWYDVERDYDFVYVAASRDGGASWTLLQTPEMTTTSIAGSNLGPGYTGKSGGGAAARWLAQRVALPDGPGGQMLIRFWYVTDDAVTREGIALDAIRIVDGETGIARSCDGLEPRGWAQIGATLPQRWLVQAIEFAGDEVRVRHIPVDASGAGDWTSEGRRVDRVVIAVSGATAATLQRAGYEVTRAL